MAALAITGVGTPETAMRGVEGQAQWERFQGLLCGRQSLEGQREKMARRDQSESRSRNYIQCALSQNPSKLLV